MSQESLADRAVIALADVRGMGEKIDNDHPMRHHVRAMQSTAQSILADAFRHATEIAYRAGNLLEDYEDAVRENSAKAEGK